MPDLPLARTSRLLVDELDGELMVYDQDASTAHVLSDDVARVWQRCDGEADVVRIAQDLALEVERVESALAELDACRLLSVPAGQSRTAGYSRRDAVKKVAKVGAAAAAVPLIYSLAIGPAAAMASPVTCSQQTCSVTDSPNANTAQTLADHVCNGALVSIDIGPIHIGLPGGPPATGCQLQSRCVCTPTNNPPGNHFSCTGSCSFT